MSSTAAIASDLVPILGDIDFPYSFEVSWQWPTPPALPGTPKRVELAVEWIAADSVTVVGTDILRPGRTFAAGSHYNFADVTVAGNTWYRSRVDGVRPTLLGTARFARIIVRPSTDGAQAMPDGGILVDTVSVYRTAREVRTFCLSPWSILGGVANAWYNVRLQSPHPTPVLRTHDWGHNFFTSTAGAPTVRIVREDGTNETVQTPGFLGSGLFAKEPGTYIFTATVTLHSSDGSPSAALAPMIRLMRNPTYTSLTNPANTGGTEIARVGGGQWILAATFDAALPGLGFGGLISIAQIACRAELERGDRVCLEWFGADDAGGSIIHLGLTGGDTNGSYTWFNARLGLAE